MSGLLNSGGLDHLQETGALGEGQAQQVSAEQAAEMGAQEATQEVTTEQPTPEVTEQAPGVEAQEAPAVEATETETEAEAPAEESPEIETPEGEEQKESQETEAEAPETQEKSGVISDWDIPAEAKPEEGSQQVDSNIYSELSSDLGVNVQSKQDLIEYIDAIKSGTESTDSMPQELQSVAEVAKQGGDWKALLELESYDYDQVSDRDFLKNDILKKLGDRAKAEGFDIDDYIDEKYDATDIAIRGSEIRQSLKDQRDSAVNSIKHKAQQRKEYIDKGIKSALGNISDVDGFQLKDSNKQAIFDGLTSGDFYRQMFYNEDGTPNFEKMVENTFKLQNYEAITGYLRTKARNEGKRDVMQKLNNESLPAKPVTPQEEAPAPDPIEFIVGEMSEGRSPFGR